MSQRLRNQLITLPMSWMLYAGTSHGSHPVCIQTNPDTSTHETIWFHPFSHARVETCNNKNERKWDKIWQHFKQRLGHVLPLGFTCSSDRGTQAPSLHTHHWITSGLWRRHLRSETNDFPLLLQKACPLSARGSPPESPHAVCCRQRTARWCQRGIWWCTSDSPLHCKWIWSAPSSALRDESSGMMTPASAVLEQSHRHDEGCLFHGHIPDHCPF